MNTLLSYGQDGEVAIIALDDGKANACGFAMLDAINTALDRAQRESRAVALLGRPAVLSGCFDLKVINGGDRPRRGARRLHPAHQRLPFRHRRQLQAWPERNRDRFRLAGQLTEARLSRRHLTQATLLARLYAPAAAVDVGFLDEVLSGDSLRGAAIARVLSTLAG